MATLNSEDYTSFENIKRLRDDRTEYWPARDLAPVLEYVA
jgi:hypothetical protein